MSDFSNRKPNIHSAYPADAQTLNSKGAAGFNRVEPFLTVNKLKDRWLFGIPLKHPLTKQTLSDETLKDILNNAAARVELECNIDVFPVVRVQKHPFDKTKYEQGWSQINVGIRNIREIHELSIRTTNSFTEQFGITSPNNDPINDPTSEGVVIYSFPLNWIDMGLARKGLIHLVPLQTALNGTTPGGSYGGGASALFAVFSRLSWVPHFFYLRFVSGFEENSIPATVNDLIGTYAAMETLSTLGPLNRYSSQSIGLDSASQSQSGPGNQIYALRMQELEKKAEMLKDLIRNRFSNKIFMTHF
jgi:hypothetical protein